MPGGSTDPDDGSPLGAQSNGEARISPSPAEPASADDGTRQSAERRQAAAARILAAPPMQVPDDPADFRRELDQRLDHLS